MRLSNKPIKTKVTLESCILNAYLCELTKLKNFDKIIPIYKYIFIDSFSIYECHSYECYKENYKLTDFTKVYIEISDIVADVVIEDLERLRRLGIEYNDSKSKAGKIIALIFDWKTYGKLLNWYTRYIESKNDKIKDKLDEIAYIFFSHINSEYCTRYIIDEATNETIAYLINTY